MEFDAVGHFMNRMKLRLVALICTDSGEVMEKKTAINDRTTPGKANADEAELA